MVIFIVTSTLFIFSLIVLHLKREALDFLKYFRVFNMPQGLQCFNESGANVVDLTDSQLYLFASITLAQATSPKTPGDYLGGGYNTPAPLTLSGISPETTVAYAAIRQAGTERTTVRMQLITVTIIGVDRYVISSFESVPPDDTLIHFYKFR